MNSSRSSLAAGALAIVAAGFSGDAFAADVGVSIAFGRPGVYGRVDIGPAPALAYPAPVVVARPVVIAPPVVIARPIPVAYRVPPGHRHHWIEHCGGYAACGVPVRVVGRKW